MASGFTRVKLAVSPLRRATLELRAMGGQGGTEALIKGLILDLVNLFAEHLANTPDGLDRRYNGLSPRQVFRITPYLQTPL